ncbi:hypothetical protein E2C01_080842 [Portunus trituberculatus]|uniref:Uncharacterized protein n=1 Tax=Portunus trituberculatus TaxID=210409 RepID=A0A5B7INB2_PORTR|nr:hypothetical protein [Portunus trituberculatus]
MEESMRDGISCANGPTKRVGKLLISGFDDLTDPMSPGGGL